MLGGFGVDLGSMFGLGRVLGGSWAAFGSPWAPKIDFEARLGDPKRFKSIQNQCQDALKFRIGFGLIFDRFLVDFGIHLAIILGSC